MKPVHVSDASYKVVGRITKRERSGRGETTKVTISAELLGEDDSVYVRLEGLSVTPVRMAASDALAKDAVAQRKWLGGEGEALPLGVRDGAGGDVAIAGFEDQILGEGGA